MNTEFWVGVFLFDFICLGWVLYQAYKAPFLDEPADDE
jgi:hypothetical protein